MGSRMRLTHEQTANRRSHHALKEPRLSTCKDCGAKHMRHHMCDNCGRYKDRVVIDVAEKAKKRAERIARKQQRLGQETATEAEQPQNEISVEDAQSTDAETAKKKK